MAQLAPFLKQRFFDSNGQPLVGGKLYSFQAGTSTPQSTFTDNSAAVANANPTILDSSGEANVWIGTSAYKFVLYDADDNLMFSVDDVSDLADGSVLTSKLADAAVTTAKIADEAITPAKLSVRNFSFSGFPATGSRTGTSDYLLMSSALTTTLNRPIMLALEGSVTYTNGGALTGSIVVKSGIQTYITAPVGSKTAAQVVNYPLYLTKLITVPFYGTVDYEVYLNAGNGTLVYQDIVLKVMEL